MEAIAQMQKNGLSLWLNLLESQQTLCSAWMDEARRAQAQQLEVTQAVTGAWTSMAQEGFGGALKASEVLQQTTLETARVLVAGVPIFPGQAGVKEEEAPGV